MPNNQKSATTGRKTPREMAPAWQSLHEDRRSAQFLPAGLARLCFPQGYKPLGQTTTFTSKIITLVQKSKMNIMFEE